MITNRNWWKASCDGKVGLIPSNYIEDNTEEIFHPLHEAAKRGNFSFLLDCLANKISVSGLDKAGCTPLHWAAHGGHKDCVQEILRVPSVQINVQNKLGDTPLHSASWRGSDNIVKLLLDIDATPYLVNKEGKTPFDLSKNVECAALLKLYNLKTELSNIPTVVVTGFGPFRCYDVNPSWHAVKELGRIGIEGVNLIVREIPVAYSDVQEIVPQLWQQYQPKLMIHCGVYKTRDTVQLERKGRNGYYTELDIKGHTPLNNCCKEDGPEVLESCIDMTSVKNDLVIKNGYFAVEISEDTGRYLCDFIYYTSLSINSNVAFIHVPSVTEHNDIKKLAEFLQVAIVSMLNQL
ncbi:pyroglutamyl-peptidase 1 isoform X2 [Tachypleus tridentatus]